MGAWERGGCGRGEAVDAGRLEKWERNGCRFPFCIFHFALFIDPALRSRTLWRLGTLWALWMRGRCGCVGAVDAWGL